MKKIIAVALAVVTVLTFGSTVALAAKDVTGNGCPSGPHYNLNIIGVPKQKNADMTGNNGHRIFVPLTGKASISLKEGDFQVLDANGTDGKASFQLPNPDPDNDGVTLYSVYARALGKPGGSSKTTPYVTDADGTTWYSTDSMILIRGTGKSKFANVTKELLYIWADLDGDGDLDRLPLFGDAAYQYFWEYNNNGLKLAQLRFYEVSTIVPVDPEP